MHGAAGIKQIEIKQEPTLQAVIQGPCSKSFYLEHDFERNKKHFWKDVDKEFTKQSGVTSQSEHGCRKGIDEEVVDNGKWHYVTRHRAYHLYCTVTAQDDHVFGDFMPCGVFCLLHNFR